MKAYVLIVNFNQIPIHKLLISIKKIIIYIITMFLKHDFKYFFTIKSIEKKINKFFDYD